MKTLRLCSALLLISAAFLCSCNQQENSASSEKEIRQWMDDYKHAFEAKDTKAVMALYTPDVLAFDVVPPLRYSGGDAYTKDYDAFFSMFKGPLNLEYRDCNISSSGDLALVTCLEHVTGTMNNGQQSSLWLRDSTGLRRVNGRWFDFHDHVSVPADMDTGKARLDLQP